MENLWPTKLIPVGHESEMLDCHTLLSMQARYLETATLGVIHASVELLALDSGISHRIFLWPRGQQRMRYELLRLRSLHDSFPIIVETYHMGDHHRFQKVASLTELRTALKNIFRDEGTLRIIRTLAAEAVDDVAGSVSQHDDSVEKDAALAARPLAIGALIKETSGKEFSQVSILGVAGFISVDVIRRLTKQPDSNLALIQKLNDRFVVTLEFMGPVKMTLSAAELVHLQAQAKKVLVEQSD